jgi:hypothetical protein
MRVNRACLTGTAIAADLRCWHQLLTCTGDTAKATPKTLHYRFLHVRAVIVLGQRRRRLNTPASWP